MLWYIFFLVLWEIGFISTKFCDASPLIWGGSTSDLKDLIQLVFLVFALEQWALGHNFSEDAANWPYINRGVVIFWTHQNVGGSVPERHHLVGEVFHRDAKGPGEAEICEF